MRTTLPGIHRSSSQRKAGRVYYYYAWRGGPLIYRSDRPVTVAPPEMVTAYTKAHSARRAAPTAFLGGLVAAYRASPEYQRLAPSTKRQWVRWLDEIAQRWGTMPATVLDDHRVRQDFLLWRDERAHQPRQADYGIQVLRRVLSWAVDRSLIRANHALGIDAIYRSDRAAIIWTDQDVEAACRAAPREVQWVIRLAAETGLRRGDLAALRWDEVHSAYIVRRTAKSGQEAHIPLTDAARAVLGGIERRAVTVLTNSEGRPWPVNRLSQVVRQAANRAGVDKRLHDLRGTYATRLAVEGYSDSVIAEIMGWSPGAVRSIRRRYVDTNVVVLSAVGKNKSGG